MARGVWLLAVGLAYSRQPDWTWGSAALWAVALLATVLKDIDAILLCVSLVLVLFAIR